MPIAPQTARIEPNASGEKAVGASLRILALAETWKGSNSYAFVRALRNAGHSVSALPDQWFVPSAWQSIPLKVLRRLITPYTRKEYTKALIAEARSLKPHLLFVFKGPYVEREAVDAIRDLGAAAINFYPDVSFTAHGSNIPKALPCYDWVFTTKTFGVIDMRERLGITRSSFLPHGFDAETHCPVALGVRDHAQYDCDASFIGTWSPKKEALLTHLLNSLPTLRLKIWGGLWERSSGTLEGAVMKRTGTSREFGCALRR